MVKTLLGGLLGRLGAYAVLGLGFWMLFRGFLFYSIPQGVAGGGLVLAGMYLMVKARRSPAPEGRSLVAAPPSAVAEDQEEKSR